MYPINFLLIELFVIFYTLYISILFYYKNKVVSLISLTSCVIHVYRFIKYKDLILNTNYLYEILFFSLLLLTFYITLKTNSIILGGILLGIGYYSSFLIKQYQLKNVNFNWLNRNKIIIPFSLYISLYAISNNHTILFPFIGDVVYHLISSII